jgi:tetratricopeptide (TPR) repeat protein
MILNKFKWIYPAFLIFGLCGCAATEKTYVSVKNYTQGEFYLQNEEYGDCIATFKAEVGEYPADANAHFYLGRCYLAVDKNRSGLTHLKKAVSLDPGNPDYHFWKGVAYAANGKPKLERKCYQDALAIKPDHVQALVYIGHNRFEAGDYRTALGYYNRALKKEPDIPQALYNRALALRKLNRTPEEINAWKTYLAAYPDGSFARTATDYLNRYGDFDYRNHILGKRVLTLAQVQFEPSSARIRKVSHPSLDKLAEVATLNSRLILHIVAYQKNNRKLAEMRAKSVKKYLLDQERRLNGARLKVSWFDKPETVKVDRRVYHLDSAINFLGQTQ